MSKNKSIKCTIEFEISSEDADKLERILICIISKVLPLIKKQVVKKHFGLTENSNVVNYTTDVNIKRSGYESTIIA